MTKRNDWLSACRRQLGKIAAGLAPLLLAGLVTTAAEAPPSRPQPGQDAAQEAAEPDPAVVPFLGTWLQEDTLTVPDRSETYPVHRYILIRWDGGKMRVKTLEYLPDHGTRNLVSDWNGIVPIDRWNQWKQNFVLMPDGTISVGLSGTNGFGPNAANLGWWASGRMVLLDDSEDGPQLRFFTSRGYSPSSKGNAWQPFERIYKLVSRDIDPKYISRRKY